MVGRLLFFLGELTDQTVEKIYPMVYVFKNKFAPKVKVDDESFCFNSYIDGSFKNLQKYSISKINILQISNYSI